MMEHKNMVDFLKDCFRIIMEVIMIHHMTQDSLIGDIKQVNLFGEKSTHDMVTSPSKYSKHNSIPQSEKQKQPGQGESLLETAPYDIRELINGATSDP